jgi:hypothetical protein
MTRPQGKTGRAFRFLKWATLDQDSVCKPDFANASKRSADRGPTTARAKGTRPRGRFV